MPVLGADQCPHNSIFLLLPRVPRNSNCDNGRASPQNTNPRVTLFRGWAFLHFCKNLCVGSYFTENFRWDRFRLPDFSIFFNIFPDLNRIKKTKNPRPKSPQTRKLNSPIDPEVAEVGPTPNSRSFYDLFLSERIYAHI